MFCYTWTFPFPLYTVLLVFVCSDHHFFSLFHLCTLRYNSNLMRKRSGKNSVKVCTYFDTDGLQISSRCEYSFNVLPLIFLFWSLGPRIGTHDNFMMFSVFLLLFWSLLFGLLMFRKYSVAMLVKVFLLCLYQSVSIVYHQ